MLAHAAASNAKGTMLVLDPTPKSHALLNRIASVVLNFRKGSKVFHHGPQPTSLSAYVIDNFATKHKPPPKEFDVQVHPDWDEKVPTPRCPFNLQAVEEILRFHPSDDFVFKCLDNLRYGVQYGCEVDRLISNIHSPSLKFDWKIMGPLMEKEHKQGFCSGVFAYNACNPTHTPLPLFNLHAYQTFHVTKKLGTKARKVNHLSKPPLPVNDFMKPSEDGEIWYPFRTSKELVQHFGRNTLIKKNDKTAAYKTPKLKPQDFHLAGEVVPCKTGYRPGAAAGLVVNITTVFGGRTSYQMWRDSGGDLIEFAYLKSASDILEAELLNPGTDYAITKWVDDYHQFLAPDALGMPRVRIANAIAHSQKAMTETLGAEMTGSDFSTLIEILGHVLDTIKMIASLTEIRRQFLIELITAWLKKETASLVEFQELCGHLQFAAEVVTAGKVHILPIRAAIGILARKGLHKLPISKQITNVLTWWLTTLSSPGFKGSTTLLRHKQQIVTETAGTDAAMIGEGFKWGNFYFNREWPEEILKLAQRSKTKSMVFLEAFTTVDCVATFAEEWEGKDVTIKCDNESWVEAYTRCSSKCPFLITLLLTITHICAIHDITLTLVHIEGVTNIDPDLLSRNLLQDFKRRNPNAIKVNLKPWPITPIWP